jgi:pSer/pThr/pTyr-binding forkhead associated (FHA) protein
MSAALQGPSEHIVLNTPVFAIGREPDNQLVILDVKASSHHAIIQLHAPRPTVLDLGSTNGTFVNGLRIQPHAPCLLKPGDRIRIGDTVYTFEQDDQDATELVRPPAAKQASQPGYGPTGQGNTPVHAAFAQSPAQGVPSSAPPPPAGYNFSPVGPLSQEGPAWSPDNYTLPAGQIPFQAAPWGGVPASHTPPAPPSAQTSAAPPLYGPQGSVQPSPSNRKKPGKGLKTLLIIVAVVVVLGAIAGSAAAYMLTRPQPVITIASDYQVGTTPAGSTSTTLKFVGHKFSGSSTITFLLDGKAIPHAQAAHSDANGNAAATLSLTNDWPPGRHTLTAEDGNGYVSKQGVAVQVVTQGQANTPGPKGAPPDDANATINASVTLKDDPQQHTETLTITGKPDPNGGTVCINGDDDGQPHSLTGSSGNISYRETVVLSCSGSYKGGKFSYTEKATSDKIEFSNGLVCTAHTPYTYQHLNGTFSSATSVSGTFTSDPITVDCSDGVGTRHLNGKQGTWTGQTA